MSPRWGWNFLVIVFLKMPRLQRLPRIQSNGFGAFVLPGENQQRHQDDGREADARQRQQPANGSEPRIGNPSCAGRISRLPQMKFGRRLCHSMKPPAKCRNWPGGKSGCRIPPRVPARRGNEFMLVPARTFDLHCWDYQQLRPLFYQPIGDACVKQGAHLLIVPTMDVKE